MSSRIDDRAGPARLGFDALVSLSQDILVAHRLDGQGTAADAAARLALQRLPGVSMVRSQWYGPRPGMPAPPLVTIFPIGSAAPATGPEWRGLRDMACATVRDALDALAGGQGGTSSAIPPVRPPDDPAR